MKNVCAAEGESAEIFINYIYIVTLIVHYPIHILPFAPQPNILTISFPTIKFR